MEEFENRGEVDEIILAAGSGTEVKINNRQCRRCEYSCILNGGAVCDYFTKTGRLRGCDTSPRCAKFKKRVRK